MFPVHGNERTFVMPATATTTKPSAPKARQRTRPVPLKPKGLATIEGLITKPPVTSVVMQIDPATAQRILLERNEGNRPPKAKKVQQFSDDIKEGKWGLTGDTIKFGTDGRLLDGQNRLSAVVRSGKAIETHIVFGIDPALFSHMDIGKPRNAADILHIAGFAYASSLASTLRWAYLMDNDPYNRETLKPDFILKLANEEYPDIEPFVKKGRDVNRQFSHPVGQVSALLYHFSKSDEAKAEDFLTAWLSGRRSGKHYIIDTMQALLHSQKANNNGRIHELARAAIIVKAWNIFKAGNKGSLAALQKALNSPIESIA
jgi:hypothetical protein